MSNLDSFHYWILMILLFSIHDTYHETIPFSFLFMNARDVHYSRSHSRFIQNDYHSDWWDVGVLLRPDISNQNMWMLVSLSGVPPTLLFSHNVEKVTKCKVYLLIFVQKVTFSLHFQRLIYVKTFMLRHFISIYLRILNCISHYILFRIMTYHGYIMCKSLCYIIFYVLM